MSTSHTVTLPCGIGDTVYKICPVCNNDHKGSCERCAWRGCFVYGCDVGVWVYSDGSYTKLPLQIVPQHVTGGSLVTIIKNWGTMYFETNEEACAAMIEYDAIRSIENKSDRYDAFCKWKKKRNANIEL